MIDTTHSIFITVDYTRDSDHGEAAEQNCSRGMDGHLFCNDIQGSDHGYGFRLEPNIAQIKSFLTNVGQNIDSCFEVMNDLRANTNFTDKEIVDWYEGFKKDCPSGKLDVNEFKEIKYLIPFKVYIYIYIKDCYS